MAWALSLPPIIAATASSATLLRPTRKPSTEWWTSDHHFGHEKIIGYCARPFANADAMNRTMVDRWNDVVAEGDEVWILGDLVMSQLTVNLSAHVWRLKGRKILVPGNHDTCWKGRKKGPNQVTAYFELGGITRIIDDPTRSCWLARRCSSTAFLTTPAFRASPPSSPSGGSKTQAAGCYVVTSMRGGAKNASRSTSVWTRGTSRRSATTPSAR